MKYFFPGIIIFIMSFGNYLPAVQAQESKAIEVIAAAVCRDVVNREAVDVGTSFSSSVTKLYFFTKIVGAHEPTEIIHVWNYGDMERGRVTLNVNTPSWRTYSSKIIQPHEIGSWHVDVLDASGNLLDTVNFEITQ